VKKRHAYLLMAAVLVALAGCNGAYSSGDRVLVAKFLYDSHLAKPERYQVVVFKYPTEPLKKQVPTNYIKRLLGLPGELLAIFFGRIYRCNDDDSRELRRELTDVGRAGNDLDLWTREHLHMDNEQARKLFTEGKYKILRKAPGTMLAMRRLVYDNDHQAKDLIGKLPPRWVVESENGGWATDQANGFVHGGQAGAEFSWLQYQHILRPTERSLNNLTDADKKPQLIRDFSGYNSNETGNPPVLKLQPPNWVGDLMLEFELTVDRPGGELWLELARGEDRFQARWNLQDGHCKLWRIGPNGGETELNDAPTRVKQAGTYLLRFANFDDRLTVWVDRELPFVGEGVNYDPAGPPGPTKNDLRPALIGSKGAAVKVHHLRLWRDTYYTATTGEPDARSLPHAQWNDPEFWSDPTRWEALRSPTLTTMFVQPGHYLCLGDNSPESSDGRSWGTVPERLLLGRALMVYFPFNRAGPIK
jgi:signal peptidase I